MRNAARRLAHRFTTVLSLVLLGSLLSAGVASAQLGQPRPVTEEADRLNDLYILVTIAAFIVFILVTGALVYMLLRYRRRSDELPPQTHGNNLLEVIWTTIPIVIVLFLFVSSFVVLIDVEEKAEPEDLTVHVTGFQFSWQFEYDLADLGLGTQEGSEGTVSVIGTAAEEPILRIPVGEPVEFRLTSNDVIHSFYVRNFLYKLDVVPGRDNSFKVTAHETGTFEAQCAELCGVDHALMRFKVQVMERSEFDAFIAGLVDDSEPPQQQARLP